MSKALTQLILQTSQVENTIPLIHQRILSIANDNSRKGSISLNASLAKRVRDRADVLSFRHLLAQHNMGVFALPPEKNLCKPPGKASDTLEVKG